MDFQLLAVTILKALTELAGLFLLGQGALYVLAGRKREQNVFYQLFKVLSRPLMQFARAVTPKVVLDRHIPIVAFLLLFWLWLLLTVAKVELCSSSERRCIPQEPQGVSWRVGAFPV